MPVLDAACGTGRHAAFLAELRCDVTGVDQSSAMLAVAHTNVPSARFDEGDLEALPYDDASFELAISSLAMCHLPDPTGSIAELARVLRRGGHLVITDPHPLGGDVIGGQAFYGGIEPGQPMTWVRNHYHLASVWLRAFREAGLSVEECIEAPFTESQLSATPAMAVYPDAVRQAWDGLTRLWLWVVRRP